MRHWWELMWGWNPIAVTVAFTLLPRLSMRFWSMFVEICFKTLVAWIIVDVPDHPKGLQVRSLRRSLELLRNKLINPHLCGPHAGVGVEIFPKLLSQSYKCFIVCITLHWKWGAQGLQTVVNKPLGPLIRAGTDPVVQKRSKDGKQPYSTTVRLCFSVETSWHAKLDHH